jgi:quinoprotein glucose dehydrogenase
MKSRITWLLTLLWVALVGFDLAAQEKKQPQPDTPIDVTVTRAFPKLRIRRPVLFTNAGDGTNRLFIGEQQGVIRVMPNDENVEEPGVFLDIESQVVYKDKENEEGLLGLAFHPKFKENGQFFVYYNTTDKPHTCVVSRFTVSKDNSDKADPKSEEELLRIEQPFWNHNGGTLCFGPDGYLYIGLGDGGAANDPHGNGQNLKTWLGSILRIDVDNKDEGKAYAVPKDNPFVGKEGAQPEIFAYGFRNIWRMSFDRETNDFWVADVGQNLWEEINIVTKGGNYGWNLREGFHKFGDQGAEPRADLLEPIWEYHHDIGKSITGGYVYRGKKVPALIGCYLYGDYVSGKQWALKYDTKLPADNITVITYGEDEQGEVYFTDSFGFIYKYQATK